MKDYIEEHIEIFNEISKIYFEKTEKPDNDLENAAKEIKTKLKDILDAKSDDSLKTNTSVNPVFYYNLKSRVKGLSSLEEKLVRKNLGFNLINKLNIKPGVDLTDNKIKNKIFKEICLFDDIIGLRIVTELKSDCKSIHELILSNNEDLIDDEIEINEDELKNQPEKMQNGLPIFRMKGVYKKRYAFELQIKSKIDEAWGEMDHTIFYKDYSVTPIKNTVHETMNHVGKLLDKIEDLLLGLRNSNKEYEKNLKQIKELNEIDNELSPLIYNKLKVNFDISKIANFVIFFREKAEIVNPEDNLTDLDFKNLKFSVKDEFLNNYIKIRNNSFELTIIESLYFNWAEKKNTINNTEENYEENLNLYLDLYVSHLSEKLNENDDIIEKGLADPITLKERIKYYSSIIKIQEIFLSVNKHLELIDLENLLSIYTNENTILENPKLNLEFNSLIRELLIISFLHQNSTEIISKVENFLNENSEALEDVNIIDFAYNFYEEIDGEKKNKLKKAAKKTLNVLKNEI